MTNPLASFLRGAFGQAHGWFDGTLAGVTSEVAHWQPPGTANRIAPEYVHSLIAEDALISAMQGMPPLFLSVPTGASEPQPMGAGWGEWARTVTVNLDQTHAYASQVHARAYAFLAAAGDEDLVGKTMDLSASGLGVMTQAQVCSTLLLNIYSHSGEIAALKGIQGLKGYPA